LSFKIYSAIVLIAALVFSATLFGVSEYVLRSNVNYRDALTQNLRLYLSNEKQNVVFGDSHAGNGANGLDDYGVFWKPGMSAENLEQWVRGYVERGTVDRVILQLAPHMFRRGVLDDSDYDAYQNGREPFVYATQKRFSSSLHKYLLDALSISSHDYQEFGIYDENGSFPREGQWYDVPDDLRASRMAVRVELMRPDFELIPGRLASLERTMSILDESAADVCIVVFPIAPEYADAMEQIPAYVAAMDAFAVLADRHGATYVDLSRAGEPEHLFNQDHLNLVGGLAFAPVLEAACYE
jgi:hypothetical protein